MVHHGAGLRQLLLLAGRSSADARAWVQQLRGNWSAAALEAPDRAMLGYAVKLTRTPAEMTAGDVATLRAAGFDDRGIHDICAVTAYYAFVNRMADGLGVELEIRGQREPPTGPAATGG